MVETKMTIIGARKGACHISPISHQKHPAGVFWQIVQKYLIAFLTPPGNFNKSRRSNPAMIRLRAAS